MRRLRLQDPPETANVPDLAVEQARELTPQQAEHARGGAAIRGTEPAPGWSGDTLQTRQVTLVEDV